jgi:hypothetical protein
MWMWQGLWENKDYESFIYVGRIVVEMASYWGALGLVERAELVTAGAGRLDPPLPPQHVQEILSLTELI